MKKAELYPATVNEKDTEPFFNTISAPVFKLISAKEIRQDPVFLFSVSNAYVSPFGAVFKNGKVIHESIYKYSAEKGRNAFFSFCKKIITGKAKKINADCIVIHHSWYQNYYHWMIEIMPRLFLMRNELSGKKLVIHEQLSKFHRDTLSKFNLTDIVFAADDELAKCRTVAFTSFPNYYVNQPLTLESENANVIELNINYAVMREMTQWFKTNNALIKANTYSGSKNIYISRKKAGHRKILNEPALEQFLSGKGFTKIFLEDLTFDQQVELLHNSAIVVGIHGAGLTNILFMQAGAHVINLISDRHHEFCYLSIAGVAKVNYSHVNCESATIKENPAYNDITVDLKQLGEILASIGGQKNDERP